jgi:hypothetical protein
MADTSPISSALKSAVVTAAEAHLADVTADVERVKAAIVADLPSISTTAISVEALVKAEVAKLRADVGAVWKPWMTYAVIAGASVAAGVAVHFIHLI